MKITNADGTYFAEITRAQAEERGIDEALIIAAEEDILRAQLWQAAHNYEYAAISGSAFSMTDRKAELGLPKSVAVRDWVTAIWTEYYTRKADIQNASLDFSSVGAIPFPISEIIGE